MGTLIYIKNINIREYCKTLIIKAYCIIQRCLILSACKYKNESWNPVHSLVFNYITNDNNYNMKTLVFGASTNPSRYSYLAIERLQAYDHEIEAIGGREAEVMGVQIQVGHPELHDIHTITMYMGEARQADHEDYLLSLQPKRIIFNPGAENRSLYNRAKEQGIEVLEACTLVMLNTGQY